MEQNNGQGENTSQNTENGKSVNQDELFKNLKTEFSRKQENIQSELMELKNLIISQQQSKAQTSKQDKEEKPDPIVDPDGYENYILQKAEAKIAASVNQNNQRQTQLATLVQQFPELQDGTSELTKKAVDYYNKLTNEEKMSPNAYKFAVQDAAMELGVVPMSKRKTNDYDESSDYVGSSSNSNSSNSSSRKSNRNKEEEIDPMTLEFARALGRPVNDPEYIKRLKETSKRKNWTKGQ